MNENMTIYEKVRNVPQEALKPINGGRLKGMSDINPMWRIKMLTEMFGICGIGWKVEITDKRLEQGSGAEIVCFVDINLYVKVDGEWSAPIPGMGGSSFVTQEKSGPYTSDECFKMAYTDAISVACKSLGFAADVYFANDRTKYSNQESQEPSQTQRAAQNASQGQTHNQSSNQSQSNTGQSGGPKALASEGQTRMLYAKHKATGWTDFEQISEFLGYEITKFAEVRAADVTKLAQYLDRNKAA